MDLREKKTLRNIKNAFLELRKEKFLERIKVKEICERAEISKATFYLHYSDIYDLSETLQKEVIISILDSIPNPETIYKDNVEFTKKLFEAFYQQEEYIDILFSGSQLSVLPTAIEKEIKTFIYNLVPEKKEDPYFNILLTYQIQGGYHAYIKNRHKFGKNLTKDAINKIVEIFYNMSDY